MLSKNPLFTLSRHTRLHSMLPAFGALLFTLLFVAQAGAFSEPKGIGGQGVTAAADEMIGTLPTYWTSEELPHFSLQQDDPKDLMLSGLSVEALLPKAKIQDLFEAAQGNGIALINPGGFSAQGVELSRVRVFGQVHLVLNEAQASSPNVKLSLHLGANYSSALCSSSFGGQFAKLFSAALTGPDLLLGLSKPWIKAKYVDNLYQFTAQAATGQQAALTMKISGGQLSVRMQSE